jgi:hypothetical protein
MWGFLKLQMEALSSDTADSEEICPVKSGRQLITVDPAPYNSSKSKENVRYEC